MNRCILVVSTENVDVKTALQSYLKAPSQHVKLRQGVSTCQSWTLSTGILSSSQQKGNLKSLTQ